MLSSPTFNKVKKRNYKRREDKGKRESYFSLCNFKNLTYPIFGENIQANREYKYQLATGGHVSGFF